MLYHNPIIPGFHPDPSLCRVGDHYYLVTSSFEYFPGVPVFHSRDLVNWRQIGHCLTRPEQLPLTRCSFSAGIFAPTIRHHNGRFYMVTTNVSGGGHFYVHAENPAGPWSDIIPVKLGGIDPSFTFDDDGKVYFNSTGHGGIAQVEIDIASGRLLTEPRTVWPGTGGQFPEGPHLYRIDGRYYLLISEGGTEYGHMVTLARGDSPWGPFVACPYNPILSHRSRQCPVQCTGHADLFEDHRGNWWLVFLGVRPNSYPPCYHLGRETFLAPVTWTADGWPVVNGGQVVPLELDAPLPEPQHPWPAVSARDDFDSHTLRLCWNFLRNPHAADWSLTERPGWLRLKGSPVTLDEEDAPAWLGRRQQHFACRFQALLEFAPEKDGEEAGITAFMNHRHHYEIAVARREGVRCVFLRRRIGSLQAVVAEATLPDGPVLLILDAERDFYTCRFAAGSAPLQTLGAGETRYLATEVAGGFTGVYLAMYATGRGRHASAPADFDWCEYLPGE